MFITNIPFSIDNHLLKEFAEKTGPVRYALICMDKLTEHSKGSGFVKFAVSFLLVLNNRFGFFSYTTEKMNYKIFIVLL